MEPSPNSRRQRSRLTLPPLYGQSNRNARRNPSYSPLAADFGMEEDAISTLMDIDDSPLNGAGYLDEDDGDGDGDMFVGHSRGGRGGGGLAMDYLRGPLPYTDFFNSFDGADFDDADLD